MKAELVAVKLAVGAAQTETFMQNWLVPQPLLAVRQTLYVPVAVYVWFTAGKIEGAEPSPKFQDTDVALDEVETKSTDRPCGLVMKLATGAAQTMVTICVTESAPQPLVTLRLTLYVPALL